MPVSSAAGFVHALASMNVDRRAAVVHDLHKAAGNRAVSRLLAGDPVLARQQRGAGLPSRRFQRPEAARLAELIDHASPEVLQTIRAALAQPASPGASEVTLDVPVFQGTISPLDVIRLTDRVERRMTNGSVMPSAPPVISPLGTGAVAPASARPASATAD
jgi:hypothetical protein